MNISEVYAALGNPSAMSKIVDLLEEMDNNGVVATELLPNSETMHTAHIVNPKANVSVHVIADKEPFHVKLFISDVWCPHEYPNHDAKNYTLLFDNAGNITEVDSTCLWKRPF